MWTLSIIFLKSPYVVGQVVVLREYHICGLMIGTCAHGLLRKGLLQI